MIVAVLALLAAADVDPTIVEARALFEEGRREYDEAHYAEARAWFDRAWEKKPLPELLFNIGQCDFQLGDYEAAIEHYERYLELEPTADNRALVIDLIAEARIAQAAEPQPPSAFDTARAAFASVVEPVVAGGAASGNGASKPLEDDDTWLWAGAIAGTIAVVAVGGAVAFALASPGPTLGVIDGRAP